MNKKRMEHGITAGALAVFTVLGLACATASTASKWADVSYDGEGEPLLEGKSGTIIQYGSSAPPPTPVEFRSGGKMIIGSQSNCTWKRYGDIVEFAANNGWWHGEGTYNKDTQKIMGSAENSEGTKWDFTIELGSSAGVSSSAGSASQNTRSYSVTVWYTSSGTRLSSIYTVQAVSKDEAEREAERIWKTQFGWNQDMKFQEAVSY
jgi:hypothetical protein